MQVLIAGGSGFIGRALQQHLNAQNIETRVLTRNASKPYHIAWSPKDKSCDLEQLSKTTHLVNLTGAGIADQRWTQRRKKELLASRVDTATLLHSLVQQSGATLQGYVGVSGVNAFGFSAEKVFNETDAFGQDFLSSVVQQWESAHRLFESIPCFTILRLGMVLSPEGGAYAKIAKPIKLGFGAVPGKGSQLVPWIHLNDVVKIIHQSLETPLGLVHGVAQNSTMKEITQAIAHREQRTLYLPNIPTIIVRLIFGEMGKLLTESLSVSNTKLLASFKPNHLQLSNL